MTELYRFVTPSFLNGTPEADRLTNSLVRDTKKYPPKTAHESPVSAAPIRPALSPYSPF